MKQHIMKLTLAFALITLLMPAMAQSTLGKDFWVSFLPHGEHINYVNLRNELELVVIGKRPCTGRVTNPNTQWSTTFEVQAGTSTKVSIRFRLHPEPWFARCHHRLRFVVCF